MSSFFHVRDVHTIPSSMQALLSSNHPWSSCFKLLSCNFNSASFLLTTPLSLSVRHVAVHSRSTFACATCAGLEEFGFVDDVCAQRNVASCSFLVVPPATVGTLHKAWIGCARNVWHVCKALTICQPAGNQWMRLQLDYSYRCLQGCRCSPVCMESMNEIMKRLKCWFHACKALVGCEPAGNQWMRLQ